LALQLAQPLGPPLVLPLVLALVRVPEREQELVSERALVQELALEPVWGQFDTPVPAEALVPEQALAVPLVLVLAQVLALLWWLWWLWLLWLSWLS